jgi:murein DD-endopeptidase MepM/ murein hydrolase activator NlpD
MLVAWAACAPTGIDQTAPPSDGAQCAFRVCITGVRARRSLSYLARNDAAVPATVVIQFRQLWNLAPAMNGSITRVVEPGERTTLATLRVVDRRRRFSAQPVVMIDLGSDSISHRPTEPYAIPFGGTEARKLVSGAGGPTHLAENFYSFDFEMPEGTPVLAARGGVVVYLQDGFTEGGLSADLIDRANLVSIGHADGTIASYGHLLEGLEVAVGDSVTRGQVLGRSGSTGFSGRPHLHFHVGKRLMGGAHRTIPVVFDVGGLGPVELEEGTSYPPGSP